MTQDAQEIKSILENLENEIKLLKEPLLETIEAIKSEGFSNYPVIICHPMPIPLGEVVLEKTELGLSFNYSATTIEDLIKMKILLVEKVKPFMLEWQKNKDHFCFLLILSDFQKFIFAKL